MKAVNVNDVLKILRKYGKCIFVTDEKKYSSMVDEIANLKALKQQPCEDCVRRQEVLDVLKDKWNMFSDANDAMQESIDTIEALKPVTPKPKMGRWIDKDGISDFMYCSNCGGKKHYSEKWIGCPYCLADMRESYKEESEDKE